MNIRAQNLPATLTLLMLFSSFGFQVSTMHAQGTAFTYQGRLNDGGTAANGSYDMRFILYDGSVGGSEQGPILTNSAIAVSNGLFTVTLDFGNAFPGAARWLDFAVRTNGGGVFSELDTRQPLTPTPYAITAGNVISGGLASGTYGSAVTFSNSANQFTGVFTGDGANVTNVNAATLGGLAASSFWQLGGNNISGGQVLGTLNNQPMDLYADGQRAMRLILRADASGMFSNAPNVIGGSAVNLVMTGVVGGTVAGGGGYFTNGQAFANTVTADFGTVGGGFENTASGTASFVGGGSLNLASGGDITSGGGTATVCGGDQNSATNDEATVGGGGFNVAGGELSVVAGGYGNMATNQFASVLGGYESIAGGNISTVGGGSLNDATGGGATIGGGEQNNASGDFSTVPGGQYNIASGSNSFAAGCLAYAQHDGSFVWSDGENGGGISSDRTNQFKIQAGGGVVMLVSGSSGVNPAALKVNSTSGSGVAVLADCSSGSTNAALAAVNTGTGDLIDGLSGSSGTNVVFQVLNDGTVNSKGVVLTSDRNTKENFVPVDSREVLDKVAALPITRWNFKTDSKVVHLGPMAQDFYAAFGVGPDDKHIAVVDAGGVALAAIQGLNEKMNEKDAEIQKLKRQNEALEKRLDGLEQMVGKKK